MLTVLLSGVSVQLDRPRPVLFGREGKRTASWKWAPLAGSAVLLLVGCASSPPDFFDVLRQDCQRGSAEACSLYSSLQPTVPQDSGIAPPVYSREIAAAILAGMRQARLDGKRIHPQQVQPLVEDPPNTH